MKYRIVCRCGHEQEYNRVDMDKEEINRLSQGLCISCHAESVVYRRRILTVSYGEYKRLFPDYKVVPGTYNSANKTVSIRVPSIR